MLNKMDTDRQKKKKKEQLTIDIDEVSNNIRKKYRALKYGESEKEELLKKSYKPILDPLEKISQKMSEVKEKDTISIPSIKTKRKRASEDSVTRKKHKTEIEHHTPDIAAREGDERVPSFLQTELVAETSDNESPLPQLTPEDVLSTPEGRSRARDYINNLYEGPLARKYLRMSVSAERDRIMDHTYGVRHEDNQWMIGKSPIEIDGDDDSLHVEGIRYNGTPGLYELLFMKDPKKDIYNDEDLLAYKNILRATNAHRRDNDASGPLKASKSKKWTKIISPMFLTLRFGHGVQMKHTPNVVFDYVHWDNPNELVDRLRLLIASQNSGHTGHTNEIVSIVEELREAGIIV